MKLLQINISANQGSHGRIAEEIGQLMILNGWKSYLAYGRWNNPCQSRLIRIGSDLDEHYHALQTRIFDNHGLCSKKATQELIQHIDNLTPDIIHLHNIHGYYLNYPLLFDYLSKLNTPVVWTLHDCWPITGHCAHFIFNKCNKWQNGCHNCQFKSVYPKSLILSNSEQNFELKRRHFNSLKNLTLVPVSSWLDKILKESMLSSIPRKLIHNGIDLDKFRPQTNIPSWIDSKKKVILGVSFDWDDTKGIVDFVKLRTMLDDSYMILLVGLSKKQIKKLPSGIVGIERTQNVVELMQYYSRADVFANPTYEDNFPTTNLEALACGTPVVTYNTGGSPEAIDERTGLVVPYGDVDSFCDAVRKAANNKVAMTKDCRIRAEQNFNKNDRYLDYLKLYESLL